MFLTVKKTTKERGESGAWHAKFEMFNFRYSFYKNTRKHPDRTTRPFDIYTFYNDSDSDNIQPILEISTEYNGGVSLAIEKEINIIGRRIWEIRLCVRRINITLRIPASTKGEFKQRAAYISYGMCMSDDRWGSIHISGGENGRYKFIDLPWKLELKREERFVPNEGMVNWSKLVRHKFGKLTDAKRIRAREVEEKAKEPYIIHYTNKLDGKEYDVLSKIDFTNYHWGWIWLPFATRTVRKGSWELLNSSLPGTTTWGSTFTLRDDETPMEGVLRSMNETK